MQRIVRAKIKDAMALTHLAIRSEAYWGYDDAFMEKFKAIYHVSEDFIENHPTYMMMEGEKIVGFYGILLDEREISLEYFFIEPQYIGQGYGKIMWEHLIGECEMLGIKAFTLVTSPQAKDFYIKRGAKLCGEVDSLVIEGRKVPKLIYWN